MQVSLEQIIVWLIIGALAGFMAGMVVRRNKRGFGPGANLAVGLVGAVVGGFLFRFLGIRLGLANIVVSLEDLVSAFIGALVFLFVVWLVRR